MNNEKELNAEINEIVFDTPIEEDLVNKNVEYPSEIKEPIKLSDEQVDEIAAALTDNISENTKILREITKEKYPSNVMSNKIGLKPVDGKVEVNSVTGQMSIVGMGTPITNKINLEDVETLDPEDLKLNIDDIKDEDLKGLKDSGMSDEDVMELLNIISRYQKGEKFSIFNAMPSSMKTIVRSLTPSIKQSDIQTTAKVVLEQFINQINVDKTIIDFNESLAKEFGALNITNLFSDYLKEEMDKLNEKADLIEKEYPEKAKLIREIYKSFVSSYTMDILQEALKNDTTLKRKIKKGIKRFGQVCTDIDYKYHDSKYTIKSVDLICQILDRHINKEEFDYEDITKFIVLYYEVTKNMKCDKIVDHTFMYYTMFNIAALDYGDINTSQFNIDLLNNIENTMRIIKEIK